MAEYGEWNRKGATLSDVTAKKEYGVDQEFIVKGIRAGSLRPGKGDLGKSTFRPRQQNIVKYVAEAGSVTTGWCMETWRHPWIKKSS